MILLRDDDDDDVVDIIEKAGMNDERSLMTLVDD